MLGIEPGKWFSLFKRGVELLADMSTFQFTQRVPELENRKQFPKQLQSGKIPQLNQNADMLTQLNKNSPQQVHPHQKG